MIHQAILSKVIFPADNPSVASLSGHGVRLRLAPPTDLISDPGHLRIAVHPLPVGAQEIK